MFSCYHNILLSHMRTIILLIYKSCSHCKTHVNNFSPEFGEWFWKIVDGVYPHHLHKIVRNMTPKKTASKCHGFLVQGATSIRHVQHHTRVAQKYRCMFGYLDSHWYKVLSKYNRLLYGLFQRCEISTKCWSLHRGLEFLWPCSGCWYHYWKKLSDKSPSDLVVPMVGIHKYMDLQFIKDRFRKLLINILAKYFILISNTIPLSEPSHNGHQLSEAVS